MINNKEEFCYGMKAFKKKKSCEKSNIISTEGNNCSYVLECSELQYGYTYYRVISGKNTITYETIFARIEYKESLHCYST